jgi:2-C-methyl-D-erythritol 4-phosphate cytidylyltransferase
VAVPFGGVWAVVVAAGSGTRFGSAKQFAPLGSGTVVQRSVATARAASDGVVVVLPDGLASTADATPSGRLSDDPSVVVVVGGPTRAASVRCGLASVPSDAAIVVVHDGARPLASPALFSAVVDAVRRGADAAIPGLPVADTLKRVEGGTVVATVDRADLVAVQTPQAFRADVLRRAHASGTDATDDAALVEQAGGRVVVVAGEDHNIKLTTAADLDHAEAHLATADDRP